jgi:hypothetical protein
MCTHMLQYKPFLIFLQRSLCGSLYRMSQLKVSGQRLIGGGCSQLVVSELWVETLVVLSTHFWGVEEDATFMVVTPLCVLRNVLSEPRFRNCTAQNRDGGNQAS